MNDTKKAKIYIHSQDLVAFHVSKESEFTESVKSAAKLYIECDTYSYLGDGVKLDLSFLAKKSTPTQLADIVCNLRWYEYATGDEILSLSGTLSQNVDDMTALITVADVSEQFNSFDVQINGSEADFISSLIATAGNVDGAFNTSNSLGRQKNILDWASDNPEQLDTDALFDTLTSLDERPSELALYFYFNDEGNNLPAFTTALRAAQKLNIPLTVELDPTLSIDGAISTATNLGAQDERVQIIWSPNVARPSNATSLRGRKKPCHVLGQYLAMKTLRNAKKTSQGIPLIATPVAGADFPFTYPAMEQAAGITFTEENLERLADAKINVVRRVRFDTGVKYVLSDVLTQYSASNSSALKLVNAVEIACYTTNRCIDILKRHLLKKTSSYLADASRDIQSFLDGCVAAGLLVNASDLGGNPYSFSLTPDEAMPFERVRFYLARRPEGAVRSVIFDDDVIVK